MVRVTEDRDPVMVVWGTEELCWVMQGLLTQLRVLQQGKLAPSLPPGDDSRGEAGSKQLLGEVARVRGPEERAELSGEGGSVRAMAEGCWQEAANPPTVRSSRIDDDSAHEDADGSAGADCVAGACESGAE